jgi:hypothetical protein
MPIGNLLTIEKTPTFRSQLIIRVDELGLDRPLFLIGIWQSAIGKV